MTLHGKKIEACGGGSFVRFTVKEWKHYAFKHTGVYPSVKREGDICVGYPGDGGTFHNFYVGDDEVVYITEGRGGVVFYAGSPFKGIEVAHVWGLGRLKDFVEEYNGNNIFSNELTESYYSRCDCR